MDTQQKLLEYIVGAPMAQALTNGSYEDFLQALNCQHANQVFFHQPLFQAVSFALRDAIQKQDHEVVKVLVKHCPKSLHDSVNVNGESLVMLATYVGDVELIRILALNGCTCDSLGHDVSGNPGSSSPVMHCIRFDKIDCLRELVKHTKDSLNAAQPWDQGIDTRFETCTPLGAACMLGRVACVEVLASSWKAMNAHRWCPRGICGTDLISPVMMAITCDSPTALQFRNNAYDVHIPGGGGTASMRHRNGVSPATREKVFNVLLDAHQRKERRVVAQNGRRNGLGLERAAGAFLYHFLICTAVENVNERHRMTSMFAECRTLCSIQGLLSAEFSRQFIFDAEFPDRCYLALVARLIVAGASWPGILAGHADRWARRGPYHERLLTTHGEWYDARNRISSCPGVKHSVKCRPNALPCLRLLMTFPFEMHSRVLHRYYHPALRAAVCTAVLCARRMDECVAKNVPLPLADMKRTLPIELWLCICGFLKSSDFYNRM